MAIVYNIYANNGAGSPIDYATPVATTSSLSYVSTQLPPGSDTTFAVRVRDTVTNMEEANTDARVRIVIDPTGTNVSGQPNSPLALGLSATIGGACQVSWAYAPASASGTPIGFQVFLSQGSSVPYVAPVATVPYIPGQVGYHCTISGPYTLSTYTAGVRAYNAAGSDGNTEVVTATIGLPTTPLMMDQIRLSFI